MSGTVTRSRKVMTYSEFVWFILSEEDKSTHTAAEFWFRVMDRDGDGIVTLEGKVLKIMRDVNLDCFVWFETSF